MDEDKLYEDCDDIEVEEVTTEDKPKSKRGRKPKDRIYFGGSGLYEVLIIKKIK